MRLPDCAGYTGRVVDVTPICASDPGMSNANMQYAMLEVRRTAGCSLLPAVLPAC